jgi:hypothetical protein
MVLCLLLVADYDGPRADFPSFDEATGDIGIGVGKVFCSFGVGGPEHQERPVGWIGKRACQNEFAAGVRFAGEAQVLVTMHSAAGDEVRDNFTIKQSEVIHRVSFHVR